MCTEHSIRRTSERTGFRGESAVRFIENGMSRGKTAADFTQDENEYLSRIPYDNCTAMAYNGYCLIISDKGDCVTVYRLPEWFGKKRFYDGKTRIRNVKRYSMHNAEDEIRR